MVSLLEHLSPQEQRVWEDFVTTEKLTSVQEEHFATYLCMLRDWNEKTNLTRITTVPDIIALHFQDSLRIKDAIDFSTIKSMCDVGSGAGFPGIPLSIMFPKMTVILLEVNNKKRAFLQAVITELGLEHCIICDLDWRTFIRQAPYEVDLFCARASLQPEELVRIFKPSSVYKQAQLVYWASRLWRPLPLEAPFIHKKVTYTIDNQERVYIFFGPAEK